MRIRELIKLHLNPSVLLYFQLPYFDTKVRTLNCTIQQAETTHLHKSCRVEWQNVIPHSMTSSSTLHPNSYPLCKILCHITEPWQNQLSVSITKNRTLWFSLLLLLLLLFSMSNFLQRSTFLRRLAPIICAIQCFQSFSKNLIFTESKCITLLYSL